MSKVRNGYYLEMCELCEQERSTEVGELNDFGSDPLTLKCASCEISLCFDCLAIHAEEAHKPRLRPPTSIKTAFLLGLSLLWFPLLGCNTLHKLYNTDSKAPEVNTIPQDYEVTGSISITSQYIPVRCLNSQIMAQVEIPGSNSFRTLNNYEFQCLQDYVRFGDSEVVILQNGKLWLTGNPVAPVGSQYKVRSVLKEAL